MPGSRHRHLPQIAFLWSCLLALGLVIYKAWVSDDAYITFRTIDNFVNGYGLRWNVTERVQVFTHPLWMFLHIPFYFVYRNIFLISIALSVTCCAAAAFTVMKTFPRGHWAATVLFFLPIALSKSLVEFSTSGLENPLTFLIFALFGWTLLHRTKRFWFWISFLTALSMVNRLDTVLVYIPALAWVVWEALKPGPGESFRSVLSFGRIFKGPVHWGQILLGSIPIVVWEAFSLLYFGFPFPNTKYAKLNTGISSGDYLQQGWIYLLDLWLTDAPSMLLMVAGFIGLVLCVRSSWSHSKDGAGEKNNGGEANRETETHLDRRQLSRLIAIALGLCMYCLYVLSVGGDFMSGRFWTLPIFGCVWLLFATFPKPEAKPAVAAALLGFLVVLKVYSGHSGLQWRPDQKDIDFARTSGIADERRYYVADFALFRPGSWAVRLEANRTEWVGQRLERLRRHGAHKPQALNSIGLFGYYGWPELQLMDKLGLSEPLLARLPIMHPNKWRIGHFARRIPEGYFQAVMTGDTSAMQPDLAAYYKKLRLVTRGSLFDGERLDAIFGFATGRFDHHIETYLEKTRFDGHANVLVVTHLGGHKPVGSEPEIDEPASCDLWAAGHSEPLATLNVPSRGFIKIADTDLPIPPNASGLALRVSCDTETVDARWFTVARAVPKALPGLTSSPVDNTLALDVQPEEVGRSLLFTYLNNAGAPPGIVNLGSEETRLRWTFRDPAGQEVWTGESAVPSGGHAFPATNLDPRQQVSLLVESDGQPIAASVLTVDPVRKSWGGNPAGAYVKDAEGLAVPGSSHLLFPFVSNSREYLSLLVLHNAGDQDVDVTLTARRTGGPSSTVPARIPAGGFLRDSAANLFTSLGQDNGYSVEVTADSQVLWGSWSTLDLDTPFPYSMAQGAGIRLDLGPDENPHLGAKIQFGYLPRTDTQAVGVVINTGTAPARVAISLFNRRGELVNLGGRPNTGEFPPMEPITIHADHLAPHTEEELRMVVESPDAALAGVTGYLKYGHSPVLSTAISVPSDVVLPLL